VNIVAKPRLVIIHSIVKIIHSIVKIILTIVNTKMNRKYGKEEIDPLQKTWETTEDLLGILLTQKKRIINNKWP